MTKPFALGFFAAGLLSAQTVNLAGVWQADLQQSTFTGPPPKAYLEVIEQKGSQVVETTAITGQHGQQRSKLVFNTDGTPLIAPFQGVPSRETTATDGTALTVTVETSGRPDTTHRKYELSNDGGKLTVTVDGAANGHTMHAVYVLTRQPDSAGDALRQPEQLASEHFKNLKTQLKQLPASEFIDQMHYFAWALNKDCEFCHVRGEFDSDKKKEKRTARAMLDLVSSVNRDTFKGKPEVNCYTCHEFREHPQARPRFEGEPEHQHHEDEDKNEDAAPKPSH